jgi:hypothetical protein
MIETAVELKKRLKNRKISLMIWGEIKQAGLC